MRNSDNCWSEEEAGMAQLDDDIGLVMKKQWNAMSVMRAMKRLRITGK